MRYTIDKAFEFEYGHRVWSQKLNALFSIDNRCICRHLHGHHGTAMVHLGCDTLTDGMVTDLKHLNCIKKFIDDVIDHKFIIDINVPLFPFEFSCVKKFIDKGFYKIADTQSIELSNISDENLIETVKEKFESFVIVDFVPTSENICKWLCEISTELLNGLNVKVIKVELSETPKSHCQYWNMD